MSGYVTQDGTDLSNIFKPIPFPKINSTGSGITITSNSGPLVIQQNTLTQPINIITNVGSTAIINISQNNFQSISVQKGDITIKTPSKNIMFISDISGATCSANFNYGSATITPTSGSTYLLTVSNPKELYILGTNSFTLQFPGNPPNGTNYRIIRASITGTLSLSSASGATFRNGTNAGNISSIVSYMMKFVYYNGVWYTCRF